MKKNKQSKIIIKILISSNTQPNSNQQPIQEAQGNTKPPKSMKPINFRTGKEEPDKRKESMKKNKKNS